MKMKKVSKVKKVGTLTAMGLGLASMIASSALARTVEGTTLLNKPVTGATIRVMDANGNILVDQANATNDNGFFSVNVSDNSSPVLRIQSTGGSVNGQALNGTLYGETSGEADELLVHLNVGTTLMSLYQDAKPSVTRTGAQTKVQQYLGLSDLVSMGAGIENPALQGFSAETFMKRVSKVGGFDQYNQKLIVDMIKNPTKVRTYKAPAGQLQAGIGPAWIGEKLLSGIVGDIGSKIFNQFLSGIGIPSGNEQILNVLNQVMAQLNEIKKQIQDVEAEIKQTNYDIRSSSLRKTFAGYTGIVDKINELNKIALENTGPNGQPKDAAKAKQIADTTRKYMQQITEKDITLITDVHSEFVDTGDSNPLQRVFAEVKYMKAPIIDKNYFEVTSNQVDQYRGYQAVVTALLVDALKAQDGKDSVDAKTVLNTALNYINSETPIYPVNKLFNSTGDVAQIKNGSQFLQKDAGLMWSTSYAHVDRCSILHTLARKEAAANRPAGYDQMANLLEVAGLRGMTPKDYAQVFGFSKTEAEAVKMITFGCAGADGRAMYNWFGNDQQGPWSQYYNNEGDYRSNQKAKGMGNWLYFMNVRAF